MARAGSTPADILPVVEKFMQAEIIDLGMWIGEAVGDCCIVEHGKLS
jgi:hypothetical protein